MKRVHEENSNLCPYCGYDHEPTEGSSEMFEDNHCEIQCAKCGRIYFYITDEPLVGMDGTLWMPHSVFAKSIMTYNSGGGCMIDEIHLESGEVIIISDEAVGLYDSVEEWQSGDGDSQIIDRKECRENVAKFNEEHNRAYCTKCGHPFVKDHGDQTVCPKCTRDDLITNPKHREMDDIAADAENLNGGKKLRPFELILSMRGRW